MLLYIKQKIFSFNDKYDVYNPNLEPVYHVESEFLTLLSKIHLYDLYGNELFYIKKNFTFLFAQYDIYSKNKLCATVNQKFSLFSNKLSVSSDYGEIEIQGDIFGMDFNIICNGILLGSIRKKWLSIGDSYELEIVNENDAGFFTALAIAIDNCLHNSSNNK